MRQKFMLLIFLVSGTFLLAQTPEQREKMIQSMDLEKLQGLEQQFQQDYQERQQRIAEFLQRNPDAQKSFEKDNASYMLYDIQEDGTPLYINTKNRASGELIKANALWSGGSMSVGSGFAGQNMVVGIWDGGQVLSTHELLTGKVEMQANQSANSSGGNNHMTHVSGTIVGKDLGNTDTSSNQYQARGIAYEATAKNYDWDDDITEMTAFAGQGYLVSNHSYGYSNDNSIPEWTFGSYDNTSLAWDTMLNSTPNYLPFVAAGNEQQSSGNSAKNGFDLMTGSCAAKNPMVIGAVNGDESMSNYSNWGPTDDGRIKPDLVAKGTGINSSYATGDNAYSGNGENSSGTSYATPAAAAAALLLQQYYHHHNNSYMPAPVLKAVMVAGAKDLGNPGPDYKFGWGLIDVEKSAQIIKDSKENRKSRIIWQTTNPSVGVEHMYHNIISNLKTGDTGKVTATVAFADDPGTEQTAAEGTDPTTSRMVYRFVPLLRINGVTGGFWKLGGMADVNAAAVKLTNNSNPDDVKDNVVQAVYENAPADQSLQLWVRKQNGSPVAVKNYALVITGLKSTLDVEDIEAQNENELIVFPNPAVNELNVISNDELKTFQIINANGQIVKTGNVIEAKMNVESLPKGSYMITFDNGKTSKFIKR